MIIPFIAGALYCTTPKLDNKTDSWTEQDQAALLQIQKVGCKDFDPKQPCLYVFVKEVKDGEVEYTAQCGPEKPRPE